jgi:hypothetical protein
MPATSPPRRRLRRARRIAQERQREPEHGREYQEREAEVRSQPQLRHARIVDEAALHHGPAKRALQAAQRENAEQSRYERSLDSSAQRKPRERRQKCDANHPAEQPMEVFPPEDGLELRQRHSRIHLTVLWRCLVARERVVPIGLVQGRQRAHDRLPLRDREPGMGEPRHASHDDHGKDKRAAGEKPGRNLAPVCAGRVA